MWPNPSFPAVLVTFTEEILNGKLHFWCIVLFSKICRLKWSISHHIIKNLLCQREITVFRWGGLASHWSYRKAASVDSKHTSKYFFFISKQLALGWKIAKEHSGLNPPSLCNNKNYKLKRSSFSFVINVK